MISAAATLTTLRRAMLPMDGCIADHAEAILAAAADALPRAAWAKLNYVDLTAGSCMLPLAFAAQGVRRVVVNDTATRTIVAARGLFEGSKLDGALVERVLDRRRSQRRAHTPSFHFASDYLTAEICEIFDLMFHADLAPPLAATMRYLALRYVLDCADPEDGFRILMTHDRAQLRADRETSWTAFLARLDDGRDRIAARLAEITAGQAAIATRDVVIHQGDMRDIARIVDYDLPCLVVVNPPTNGVDEYVIEDQIVHSLIANRLVPLTRCTETPEGFWRDRVKAALSALPGGALFVVWGGDGAMQAEACEAVWARYGDCVHLAEAGVTGTRAALWGVFRRR